MDSIDFETRRIRNSLRNHLSGLGNEQAIAFALVEVTAERCRTIHPIMGKAITLLSKIQPHELELEVQRLQAMVDGDEMFLPNEKEGA